MSTVNNEGNLIFDSVEANGQRVYVAEFKATGPFSLHIERRESGRITVYQKSYENGKYATVKNVDIAPQDTIIDAEVPGGVFPKWIKIKSSSGVEVAEVTFESESSGGGAGTESGDWEYYKVDSSFNTLKEEELTALENVFKDFGTIYYMGSVSDGALLPKLYFAYGTKFQGFKAKGEGIYFETFKSVGLSTFKSLGEEPFASEMNTSAGLPFFNALIPCTKEEFESLITK